MLRDDPFGRLVRSVIRRPLPVLALVGLLALVGAALALRLEPSAATDTLVDKGSESFQATERFKRDFGDESIVVMVKGNLQRTVLTEDLGRLRQLEGCLSGNVPAQNLPTLPDACRELARLHPAKVVLGPATFIGRTALQANQELERRTAQASRQADLAARAERRRAAREGLPRSTQERAAKAAREGVIERFTQEALGLALRYGITSAPRINDPSFVSALVFDSTTGRPGVPKSKFAFLFPSSNAALIQARMRPDLTQAQRSRAIELFQEAVAAPEFRLTNGRGRYIVTGVPVVADALATSVQRSIFWLLGAAVLVMAATLALVFKVRLRLLPLGLALAAAAITFGALSLAGGSLTMASIAVLPVLIGLAVDYAIQFQARFEEARSGRRRRSPQQAAPVAASAGGPTIATAGVATAVGFLVLLLSPVPMVRGFGALLVLGIALALACALTAGFAALVRFGEPAAAPADVPPALPRVRRALDRAARGLRLPRLWDAASDWAARALDFSLAQPRKVLAVGLAVAVVGVLADTQTDVLSDVRELVPQDLQALRDVNELQQETGVSGQIDVTVNANDITRPEVIAWMTRFQDDVQRAHGYKTGKRCAQAKDPPQLCPALSLPDIFGAAASARDRQQVRRLLDSVPEYFSQSVVSRDRRTANLAFGIRLMPLDEQKRVVDDIKERLNPPRGVTASVVGLPVLAAEANGQLTSPWRRALTLLAALAGVFLVLLALRRSTREAAVPLIPIALATGWSGILLFVLGLLPGPLEVDLNPMSVTLSALVIAISTEFSVLLSARYRQEREAGAGPVRAIQLAYASTGTAVLASGVTAIAGFAVLMVSDIRMLRDFGIVTVVDLTVSLAGVMLVLPAALLWAEEHGPFSVRDLDPRPLLREAWDARPRPSFPRRTRA